MKKPMISHHVANAAAGLRHCTQHGRGREPHPFSAGTTLRAGHGGIQPCRVKGLSSQGSVHGGWDLWRHTRIVPTGHLFL